MKPRNKLREEYPAFHVASITKKMPKVATAEGHMEVQNIISPMLRVSFKIALNAPEGHLTLTYDHEGKSLTTDLELVRAGDWVYRCPLCKRNASKMYFDSGLTKCEACIPDRLRCHRYPIGRIKQELTTANRLDTKITALWHYQTFVKASKWAIHKQWRPERWTDGLKYVHGKKQDLE